MFKFIRKIRMNYHKKKMEYWDKEWWNQYHKTGKGFYYQNNNRLKHKQKFEALEKTER